VMILMMFVVLKLLDIDKLAILKKSKLKRERLEKMKKQLELAKV
jgi:hypothetical protein